MQEEFNAFLETVSDKPETRMAFLLLYWIGMRIGELLALTYDDINLEEKTISITKSYQRLKGKDVITQPKTPKSIRIISMPDFLADEFREYCSHLYGIMKNERLFHFTKSHMEHCMAAGIEKSGVKRIRLHDLRHSHASMLVDMGVAPLEIAERLGHEKVETTLNTYSHLYPSTRSKLESYQYLSEQEKGKDRIQERNEYRQLIHDNIEYEILCQSYGTGRVEELVELMLDAICSTKTYQQINGEAVPTQVVKSRLLKVGYEHIQYVFFSLDRSTSKVKNIRQYMLTVLYNAPATINQFYDAEVRHDMYWGKDIPDG